MKPLKLNLLFLLAALGLGLGCGLSVTPPATSTPEEVAFVSERFTIVRLHTTAGPLPDLLQAEAQKAQDLQRRPFVEFDATWCPPCQSLQASLEAKDERMMAAFDSTYIIRLDIDEWRDYLKGTDFEVDAIPVFFELDETGASTGRTITGAAWGEDIPENMAPPLREFFQATTE